MGASYGRTEKMVVALRKESVDRNRVLALAALAALVALRKESVDRNRCAGIGGCLVVGRSPQGERG